MRSYSFRSGHHPRRLRWRLRAAAALMALIIGALLVVASSTGFVSATVHAADQTDSATRILDYLYFTNFETEDPGLYEAPDGCAGKYYSEWIGRYDCAAVVYISGDSVEGPMHTNDAARVEGSASFGRAGVSPPDVVEIYGGTYPEDSGEQCTGKPIFHTATGCYIKGERIPMPESDTNLAAFAESADELSGETQLELDGAANTIHVVNFNERGQRSVKTIDWPSNGLIYVKSDSCGWPTSSSTEVFNADGATEAKGEKGCGNVYVRGTYSRPLTIAAEDDLIINGNIYPTSVAGKLGAAPSGPATLGLIAENYVRIYHPVSTRGIDTHGQCSDFNLGKSDDPNRRGSQRNIWIYAAILATDHTFMVDNFLCGSQLGELHVYGAVAQNYRGIVGTLSASGGSGYIKDYKYDSRLAIDQPPYFLARVSGECPLSESAIALIGASGSRRKPFTVRISSFGIKEIAFYLDGRAFATLSAAQARNGEYAVRVNPRKLSYGVHTVSVKTVMEDAVCPPIARSGVFVHPRTPRVVPRFTG